VTTLTRTAPTTRSALSPKLLAGGFVAGMVMGMWQMIVEALLPNGAGFWGPLIAIGATVLRNLQTFTKPAAFDTLGVFAGLMGHMMNSIIFGLIFALLIAPRTRSLLGRVLAGMVYAVAIFVVMWFVVAPIVDPAMLKVNGVVFFIGHLMWGAALGLVNHWVVSRA
jgi:uncharacterized membrane protein YagU involved in acid resistance